MEVTLGDIIGYILTFVVGALFGGNIQKMKVSQKRNRAGGDIIGGNKHEK